LQRFEELLKSLHSEKIYVFGEDNRIEEICKKYLNNSFFYKPFNSWNLNKTYGRIKENLKKKQNRFHVPEFFSADYILVQLLKFESVLVVSQEIEEHEHLVWIDAGLHPSFLLSNWEPSWESPNKIHALQIGPKALFETWVLETPFVSIAGTCWGGSKKAMQTLCSRVLDLHEETLGNGMVGNDQQYLSIIFYRHSSDFSVKRSFTSYIPFFLTKQNFNNLTKTVLNDSEPENVVIFPSYYIVTFLFFCIVYKLIKTKKIF